MTASDDEQFTAAEVKQAESMLRWVTGAHGNQLIVGHCADHDWTSRRRSVNDQHVSEHRIRWLTIEDTIRHLRKKHRP